MTSSSGGNPLLDPFGGTRTRSPTICPTATKPGVAWNLARATLTVVFCAKVWSRCSRCTRAKPEALRTIVGRPADRRPARDPAVPFCRPGADLHSRRSYLLLGAVGVPGLSPARGVRVTWIGLPPFLAGLCCWRCRPPRRGPDSLRSWPVSGRSRRALRGRRTRGVRALDAVFFGLDVYPVDPAGGLVDELHRRQGRDWRRWRSPRNGCASPATCTTCSASSLSAITLKGELAYRLMRKYPGAGKDRAGRDPGRRPARAGRRPFGRHAATGNCPWNRSAGRPSRVLAASEVDVAGRPGLHRPAGADPHHAGQGAARGRHERAAAQQGRALRDRRVRQSGRRGHAGHRQRRRRRRPAGQPTSDGGSAACTMSPSGSPRSAAR